MHHAILYISLSSLHHYDMKLPNFTLYGVGEQNTKIVALFLETEITIDTVPIAWVSGLPTGLFSLPFFPFSPETPDTQATVPKKIWPRFAKLNEIE